MEQPKIYQEGEKDPSGFTIENTLNTDPNELPFGYYNPDTEGKLTWICNKSQTGQIVSVFCFDHGDRTEKEAKFLEDMDQAIYFKDELVKNGWRPLVPPKINFTVTKEDGTKSEMNRQQKRALAKKIRRMEKKL